MYIIARYFLKSPNYKYFYNFNFEDYLQRVRVVKTYEIRYLRMTQGRSGDTFGLEDPPLWNNVLEVGAEVVVSNSQAKRAPNTTVSLIGLFCVNCLF